MVMVMVMLTKRKMLKARLYSYLGTVYDNVNVKHHVSHDVSRSKIFLESVTFPLTSTNEMEVSTLALMVGGNREI